MEFSKNIVIEYAIRIGISFFIFFISNYIAKIIYSLIIKLNDKTSFMTLSYKNSMKSLIKLAMWTVAGFIIISVLFKDIGPFIAGLGVSGVIIAFAVQEPLSNFICGILIMVSKLFVEGEAIEMNDASGSIEEINLNHVKLKTWDGKLIQIPSKTVWMSKITHFWPDKYRRNELSVGIAYDNDLKKAFEILKDIMDNTEFVVKTEKYNYIILFDQFGGSSMDFVIKYWTNQEHYFNSKYELAKLIKSKFDENNIEIPFMQVDIHNK